jgi:ABC-type nitrate/sulfonate/bicarbonate transport system permease component
MSPRVLSLRVAGFVLVLGLLGLWEAISRAGLVAPIFVPPVSAVIERFFHLMANGVLPLAFIDTFQRIVQGYAYAAILGVGLGVLMGSVAVVYRTLDTAIELVRPLPSAAIIPIVMLFLGLGDAMKVFIIAWTCFFPILLSTVHGVRSIEGTLIDTARTFRFGRVRTFVEIILPAASPHIATGLRLSLSLSLILGVTTELVAGENGIGFFILEAQRSFRAVDMYAGVLALGIVGYLMNRVFVALEARVLSWHHGLTIRQAAA